MRGPRFLSRRACVALAVAVGVLLVLRSIGTGLLGDDWFQMAAVHYFAPWDLFRFWDGHPAELLARIRSGELPWITDPRARMAFFRPLASLTHFVDYRFWPSHPVLMHLENVAWYALLVALVGTAYRVLQGRTAIAGLAALAYAMDYVHGPSVAWIAERNALMAAVFATLVLLSYHRYREGRGGAVVPIALFVAGLLCSEAASEVLGYLVAYAAFLDGASRRRRLFALLPYVAITLSWWAMTRALGYGVAHTGLYLDLLANPRGVVLLPARMAGLVLIQLGLPGGGFLPVLPLGAVVAWQLAFLLASAVVLVWAARRDRRTAFWLAGGTLSLVPACAAIPHARLLLIPSIGLVVAALLALAQLLARRGKAWTALKVAAAPIGAVWLLALFVDALWLPFVGLAFPARARLIAARSNQDAIVVDARGWFGVASRFDEQPGRRPRSATQLASARRLDIERPGPRTLELRARGGLSGPAGRTYHPGPFRRGTRVRSRRCTISVVDVAPDGEPTAVRYAFDRPLEDPSLAWFVESAHGFVPYRPPPVGGHAELSVPRPIR